MKKILIIIALLSTFLISASPSFNRQGGEPQIQGPVKIYDTLNVTGVCTMDDDLLVDGGDLGLSVDPNLLQLADEDFTVNGETTLNDDTFCEGDVTIDNAGGDANSYKLNLLAHMDAGDETQTSSIRTAWGLDPYMIIATPSAVGAETDVVHLDTVSLRCAADGGLDLGATGANRFDDIFIAGDFDAEVGSVTAQTDITSDTGNLVSTAGSVSAATTVSAGTTVTAGTGITATTGNIAASAGAVSASTTVTAGTNLVATAGSVSAATTVAAGTTVTGGTGVIATTGDISASAGAVSANTTVTAGTNLIATAGSVSAATTVAAGTTVTGGTGVTATTGNVVATAGAVSANTTVTAGTGITATTGNIAASAGAVSANTTVTAGTDLVATTGDVTSGDDVIAGDDLVGRFAAYSVIPIEWCHDGAAAPAAAAEVTSGNGAVQARAFGAAAGDTVHDVVCPWHVPSDIVAASGIKFMVTAVLPDADTIANQGISFKMSGDCVGDNDPLGVTFGAEVETKVTGVTAAQHDIIHTPYSGAVTVDDLAVSELAQLHFERDTADADDDYDAPVDVIYIVIKYEKLTAGF